MNKENFESRAEKLLRDTDAYRVPVAIDKVAERLNITLEAAALGEKVSGLLVVKNERGAIGHNLAHARVRQRLTMSHEIAHFMLHAKKGAKNQLFIDRYQAGGNATPSPTIGHPVSPIMMRNACKWPLLSGRQNFFNPFPGSALKHEVLQVKFCAHAICRCE